MRSHHLLAVLLAAVLCGGPTAASSIPWSYSTTVTPNINYSGQWHFEDSPSGINRVIRWNFDFYAELQGATGNGTGPADVAVFRMSTFALGPGGFGDFVSDIHQFTVNFQLTDADSATSELFAFAGNLSGFVDGHGGAGLQVGFDTGSLSKTVGGNVYTVTLLPYSYNEATEQVGPNTFIGPWRDVTARVDVRAADAPEPGTFALAGVGIALLGVAVYRKRGGPRTG